MIMKIFSVRDAKVEAFMQPFFSPTMGAAIRSLSEAVNDPKHEFSKNSADYSLWLVGDFDDSTGVISAPDDIRPRHCIDCRELFKPA